MFIYFSSLLDMEITDKEDQFIGKLYDIVVTESDIYPKAVYLVIRLSLINRKYAVIPWENILSLTHDNLQINLGKKEIIWENTINNRDKFSLKKDMLDRQVVDTYNHNVIRVNDLHLLVVDKDVMVAHVDIGARGFIRRLGFEKIVDSIIKIFNKNSTYLSQEKLIPWKNIQPLTLNPVSKTIKVNVSQRQLNSIHPADLSEIMLDLDHKHRLALFQTLDLETRSAIFAIFDFPEQKSLLDELSDKEISEIISKMPSDEATDLLDVLPKAALIKILAIIEGPKAKKLSTLLGYESESAGGLMTTEFFAFNQNTKINEVIESIKKDVSKPEFLQYICIVDDENKLLGITNLKKIISLDPQENIFKAKLFKKNIYIYPEDTVKEVAMLMEKYKLNILPVVNEQTIIQGIITIDDILDKLISIAWRRWRKKFRPPVV